MADEKNPEPITVYCCGPSGVDEGIRVCKCECATGGPCEHVWDGPWEERVHEGGATSGSATCSRCGMSAINHSLWVDP